MILIGYSEESISQVNENENEITAPQARERYHRNLVLSTSVWVDLFLDFLAETAYSSNQDRLFVINRNDFQNIKDHIDSLPIDCIQIAKSMLRRLNKYRRGAFDEDLTDVQRVNEIQEVIDNFHNVFEEEMRRCQADHSDTADEVNR